MTRGAYIAPKTVPRPAGNRLRVQRPSCFWAIRALVVSQPITMKLFAHIDDNILHQATVADFWFRPLLISNRLIINCSSSRSGGARTCSAAGTPEVQCAFLGPTATRFYSGSCYISILCGAKPLNKVLSMVLVLVSHNRKLLTCLFE